MNCGVSFGYFYEIAYNIAKEHNVNVSEARLYFGMRAC